MWIPGVAQFSLPHGIGLPKKAGKTFQFRMNTKNGHWAVNKKFRPRIDFLQKGLDKENGKR